jgi:hypothetical protein
MSKRHPGPGASLSGWNRYAVSLYEHFHQRMAAFCLRRMPASGRVLPIAMGSVRPEPDHRH